MEEKDKTADLLKKIISKMQKKKEQESRIENNTIMVKPAKVIDSNGQNVNIYFLDDKNQTIYTLYNKTGETLNENDDVKVYYTSNPAKGWVGMRCGITKEDNANGLEPIVAITINSDTDYMISTNAGVEKYEASFEDV